MMPEIARLMPVPVRWFFFGCRAIAKHVGIVTDPDTFLHAYERLGVTRSR